MKKSFLYLLAVCLLIFGFSITAAEVSAEEIQESNTADNNNDDSNNDKNKDTIYKGVFINDIDLGGMTSAEARTAVAEYIGEVMEKTLTVNIGSNQEKTPFKDFGLEWENPEIIDQAIMLGKGGNVVQRYKTAKDLEHDSYTYNINFSFDDAALLNTVNEKYTQYNAEPENASLTRENGEFILQEGKDGLVLDVDKSTETLREYLKTWDGGEGSVDLVVATAEPEHTTAELEQVQDVLGTFTTNYSSSAESRAKNVNTGAEKINGTLLYPGEEFSFYDKVAPFTEENGYGLGGAFENGEVVQSMGGGICQVSTTLYNTIILSELEITERHNHTMSVSYVKPSMDAAIAGTTMNLRFRNNTDAPIYIQGYTESRNITFTIYGKETRPEGRTIEYVSEVTGHSSPDTRIEASSAAIGSIVQKQAGTQGMTAKLWKVVYMNGVEESREVFNSSTYYAAPIIYSVGTSSSNSSSTAAVQSAIASGNIDQVRSVVNSVLSSPTSTDNVDTDSGNSGNSGDGGGGQTDEPNDSDNPGDEPDDNMVDPPED